MRVKLKNKKEFNSDKMTFDPNGKIIYIKSPAIENFQYNDFFFLKQTVNDKTLNNENNNSPKKENIKQKANKKNSKILNIENEDLKCSTITGFSVKTSKKKPTNSHFLADDQKSR